MCVASLCLSVLLLLLLLVLLGSTEDKFASAADTAKRAIESADELSAVLADSDKLVRRSYHPPATRSKSPLCAQSEAAN